MATVERGSKLLTTKTARKGMRVKLTHPDQDYYIDESNPAVGTEFECEGEIYFADRYDINVKWDNGTSNIYKDGELTSLDGGICVSIWDDIE